MNVKKIKKTLIPLGGGGGGGAEGVINKYVPQRFGAVIMMCCGTSQRLSNIPKIQKRVRSGIYIPIFCTSHKVVLNQAYWMLLI